MSDMPNRFNDVGVQIDCWYALEEDNPVMGKALEIQNRRSGEEGRLLLVRLTETCRKVRDRDGDRSGKVGEVVALDMKAGLEPIEKHVGTDAEVFICPLEKVPTADGKREFWRFQLGSTGVKAPR